MENSNSASFLSQVNMVIIARPATQTIVYRSSFDSEEGINPSSASTSGINTVEVGIGSVETCVSAVGPDYQNIGLVSLDGLFTPYAIHWSGASHSSLPYWELPDTGTTVHSWKLNPFNQNRRFYDGSFHADTFYASGHNITLANSLQAVGKDATGDLNIYKDMAENSSVNMSTIRSVSLKAPLILTGWGYDTNDIPVPSGADSGFHPEAFRNPNLWKSGPVDIRWDDDRKVWAAGGDGAKIISFSIVSSDPTTRSATVEIRQRSFTGTVFGSILLDSVVNVYDTDGCYLNEPNVDLTGRLGKAVLMNADSEAIATHFSGVTPPPSKYWNVMSLCCPSVTCEN